MASTIGLGLARLTIASSGRRIDLALPEHVPLAELIPTLLHHLGEPMRDSPDSDVTGWNVRRSDGSIIAYERSLSAQQIRDGEILHLVPRDKDWPEPDYDDLILAIADSARTTDRPWQGTLTRSASLAGAVVGLLGCLFIVLTSGPPWGLPAIGSLTVAGATVIIGAIFSRALSDSGAGGIIAAAGIPYAFTGGLLILADDAKLGELGPSNILVGSAVLLLTAVIAFFAVADQLWLFVGCFVVGIHGLLASILAYMDISLTGIAALVVSTALLLLPFSALLSIRISGMPMPDLPQTAQDLLAERPLPPQDDITASAVRTDEMFAGLLLGISLVTLGSEIALLTGDLLAQVLAAVVAGLLIIRTRSLIKPRHRMPLLISGVIGLVIITVGIVAAQPIEIRPYILVLGILPAIVLIVGSGIRYSHRRPTPALGRLADIVEFLLTISVVPLTFLVLGLFSFVRGLGG